jgi:hypothetical protein
MLDALVEDCCQGDYSLVPAQGAAIVVVKSRGSKNWEQFFPTSSSTTNGVQKTSHPIDSKGLCETVMMGRWLEAARLAEMACAESFSPLDYWHNMMGIAFITTKISIA